MAIRNLDAINRLAEMVAREKEQGQAEFEKAVAAFRKHHQDAVDAADTILAIHDKELDRRYDAWYDTNQYLWDFRETIDSEVSFYVKIDRKWSDDERKVIFVAKKENPNESWWIEYTPVKNKVFLTNFGKSYDLDDDDTINDICNEIEDFTLVFKVMEKGLSIFCKRFFEWLDDVLL
jgi:hypothetical protein